MEDTVTCEICSENFSSGKHDPLVLPCGHTFCRMCLTQLKKKNQGFACPSCRKDHNNIDVNNLIINFKLLALLTDNNKLKYEACDTHEDELIYWCRMCQLPLCGLCLLPEDHKDHEVMKVKEFLLEKKQLLDDKLSQWHSDVEANKHKIQNTLKELNNLLSINAQLSKARDIFKKLKSEVKCALSLNAIFILETEINSLKEIDDVTELLECAALAKDEATNKTDTNESLIDEKPKKISFCIQNYDGRKGQLDWQNGKLLMAAFSNKPSNSDILLKMPSEVFLELSIKGRYLGQIIILPWYRLRRAQQFAALCIGTFGVSYSGSPFYSVGNMNEPFECLAGGCFSSPHDGEPISRNLITEEEMSETATANVREGIVAGVIINNNKFGFCIYTRGKKGFTFRYPLGNVVSGMNVVKTAVSHDPVTEVTISRCGVVLSNLIK